MRITGSLNLPMWAPPTRWNAELSQSCLCICLSLCLQLFTTTCSSVEGKGREIPVVLALVLWSRKSLLKYDNFIVNITTTPLSSVRSAVFTHICREREEAQSRINVLLMFPEMLSIKLIILCQLYSYLIHGSHSHFNALLNNSSHDHFSTKNSWSRHQSATPHLID